MGRNGSPDEAHAHGCCRASPDREGLIPRSAPAHMVDRSQEEAWQRTRDAWGQPGQDRTATRTAANEEVRRFAYMGSHDFHAPLVNLGLFVSVVPVPSGAEESCHRINPFASWS